MAGERNRGREATHAAELVCNNHELQFTHCLGILAINHNRNVKIITLIKINKDLGLF